MVLNASSIGRPGTTVTVGTSGILPQPLASFNTAYMFVSVPSGVYSPLRANVPQQVNNLDDYLNLIGGEIPSSISDWAAFQSYNSVKLFFRNATNGILFVIRVAPTPSVQIIVPNVPNAGGVGTTKMVIAVNGVYFGSEPLIDNLTGLQARDAQSRPIWYITTTGLDGPDNGFDIVAALEADPRFTAGYYITRTDVEAQTGVFNIFSRNPKSLISVEEFGYVDNSNELQTLVNEDILAVGGLIPARGELVPGTSIKAVKLFAHIDQFEVDLQTKGAQLIEITTQGDGATVDAQIQVGIPTPGVGEVTPSYMTTFAPVASDIIHLTGWGRQETAVAYDNGPTSTAVGEEFHIVLVTPDAVPPAGFDASWTLDVKDANDAFYMFADADGTAMVASSYVNPAIPFDPPKLPEVHRADTVQIHYVETNSENGTIVTNGQSAAAIVAESAPGVGDGLLLTVQGLLGEDYIVEDNNGTQVLTAYLKITSKSGVGASIGPGRNRQNIIDTRVRLTLLSQVYEFQAGNYIQSADYIHAIENSFDRERNSQGFLLCPEAFARFVTDPLAVFNAYPLTSAEALENRLRIATALENQASATGFEWFAVIDCGGDVTNHTEAQIELQEYKDRIGSPQGHSAYYAPYLIDIEGIRVPPSAAVVGIAQARYAAEGFQEPPAGVRYNVRGVTDVDFIITGNQQDVSNPLGLNAIRVLANRGIVVWGARTMSSNVLFKFVNTRIILNVLVGTLRSAFDDFIFSNIDGEGALLSRIRGTAVEVCQQLWRGGALFGATPQEAYNVIADRSNNPNFNLEDGVVNVDIFAVPSPTLERLLISVNRTAIGGIEFTVSRINS